MLLKPIVNTDWKIETSSLPDQNSRVVNERTGEVIPSFPVPKPFACEKFHLETEPKLGALNGKPVYLQWTFHPDPSYGGPSVNIQVDASIADHLESQGTIAFTDWIGDVAVFSGDRMKWIGTYIKNLRDQESS